VTQMNKLYGWGFLEKLAKDDTQVTRNINDTTTLATAGERALGRRGHDPRHHRHCAADATGAVQRRAPPL